MGKEGKGKDRGMERERKRMEEVSKIVGSCGAMERDECKGGD